MTNDEELTADNEHPMVRLTRRLANTMTAEYRMLLAGVADDGDIELARALHEAGLLKNSSAKTALLSLPQHAEDRSAALDLIREIIAINGEITRNVVTYYFTSALTADHVRTLGDLGCNPNQWMDTSSSRLETPLSVQMDRLAKNSFPSTSDMAPILEILEMLRRRDVVPLIQKDCYDEDNVEQMDFFQASAHTAIFGQERTLYPLLMDQLVRQEWPDSWRKAAGSAVLEYASEQQPINSEWQITQVANLLSMAKFDNAKTWHDLFAFDATSKGLVSTMGQRLANANTCGDRGLATVQNLVEHGVAADDITINITSNNVTVRGTMLHAAILYKNPPMVQLLLEGGASPSALVSAHPRHTDSPDIGLTATDLAHKVLPEVLPMLHATRAREIVLRTARVAASARQATKQMEAP